MEKLNPFAYYRESCLLIASQLQLDETMDAEIMKCITATVAEFQACMAAQRDA